MEREEEGEKEEKHSSNRKGTDQDVSRNETPAFWRTN
jgi:hypothetical protein